MVPPVPVVPLTLMAEPLAMSKREVEFDVCIVTEPPEVPDAFSVPNVPFG